MPTPNGKVEPKSGAVVPLFSEKVPARVALVGLGPSGLSYVQDADRVGSRMVDFDQVWTLNTFCDIIQSDLIFHMDDFRVQEARASAGNKRVGNMLEAMKKTKVPIVTCFKKEEYPTAVEFPLQDVIRAFGSMYFTSTPPYAVAYAMLIGVKELHLYGMDYTWPGVRGEETGRACMEYWVGRAQQKGMKIDISPRSSLCDAIKTSGGRFQIYGYDAVEMVAERKKPGELHISMVEKELPSAAEIEKRYERGIVPVQKAVTHT